jgi:hypothetical protein
MDRALTNEHIAVAQLCLRWCNTTQDDKDSVYLTNTSKTLAALEAMAEERRSLAFNLAESQLAMFHDELADIVLCVFAIIDAHFSDAVPRYLEDVLSFFLEAFCRARGRWEDGGEAMHSKIRQAMLKRRG